MSPTTTTATVLALLLGLTVLGPIILIPTAVTDAPPTSGPVHLLGQVGINQGPPGGGGSGGGDTVPPTAHITQPATGSSYPQGTLVPITVDASDNVGVTKVQVFFDGVFVGQDTQAPYAWTWNTASANGDVVITATALDRAGNSGSDSVTVTITGGGEPPTGQQLPWGVDRIDADVVAHTVGAGIKVAVLDTGIDPAHPDLQVAGGINFVQQRVRGKWVTDPADWVDGNGHGTHVAGTIAALDNDIGVVGVAPGASLYAVRVLDDQGSGQWSWLSAGIAWATANDMDIITMSLGGEFADPGVSAAIQSALAAGIVVVAAAGNDAQSGNDVQYPASFFGVIAVGATDQADATAAFSSHGAWVDVSAPGVGIYSTTPTYTVDLTGQGLPLSYGTLSGTSQATPHVAGTVALMLTQPVGATDLDGDGVWDPTEVEARLEGTSIDLGAAGWDEFYGAGLIDAAAAVPAQ